MRKDADNRGQGRSNVFLTAVLMSGPSSMPVRVRSLSALGALLEGAALPAAGANVRLLRGELSVSGEIAWRTVGQAGIRFSVEINVAQWIKRVGHAGQQRVDTLVAALRSNPAASAAASPAEAATPSLSLISQELDRICERLAGSSSMSVELGEELVKLAALARTLEQIAARG